MLRSKLRNKYLTGKSDDTRLRNVTDSKMFRETVKPVF